MIESSLSRIRIADPGSFLARRLFEAQDPIHHPGEFRDTIVGHDLPSPSHMGVGSHQYTAALGHLPQARPVVVEVEHLTARADHDRPILARFRVCVPVVTSLLS
jgi:hypothetical protein